MPLTDDEIDLLRESLRLLQTRREAAAEVFYDNLFAIEPDLRPMFQADIREQTDKVLFAFGAVIAQIHDLDVCREMTRDLAIRHVGYGVEDRHYALVGQAVMATLDGVVGDALSPEARDAWSRAYDQIAEAMIASARDAAAAA